MSSPLERRRAKLTHDARLPADNWLGRRVNSVKSHEESLHAIVSALGKMGGIVLEGRISTDLFMQSTSNLRSTNPSEDVGKISFGITPTAAAKSWQSHGLWSPDMAMGISVSLRDRYDYSRREHGPRPTGTVELLMHARTWGKLSVEDQAEVDAIPNAWTDYGDNGFDRRGTTVSVIRQPGEQLTVTEAETIFAPLAEHVIDYFSIRSIQPPRHTPRAGNFSAGPDVVPQTDDAHLAKAIHAATQGILGLLH